MVVEWLIVMISNPLSSWIFDWWMLIGYDKYCGIVIVLLILADTTITWICKAVRHKSLNGQSSVPTHCCRPAKIDYQIKANIMPFFSCQTKQEYKPSWPRCGRASPWVDPPGNWLDDELAAQWVGQQRLQRFLLQFELLRAWEGNKACENNELLSTRI